MSVGRVGGVLFVLGALSCRPPAATVSSGQIGCDPSSISISNQDVSSGFGESTETWIAECEGKRFYCSRLTTSGGKYSAGSAQVSCKEALSDAAAPASATGAAPAIERGAAPLGAAGFNFGAELTEARQACEAAGNKWQARGVDYDCSGPASSLGFDADVVLRVCTGKICGISLSHRPKANWIGFVGDLKDRLVDKYGAPDKAEDMVTRDCKDEAAFAACLDAGTLTLRFDWRWPTGQRVALVVGQLRGAQAASVLIEYSKPVDSAL